MARDLGSTALQQTHSIHPSTSHWAALPVRRHDVRLTGLRIGHTRFTHMHLLLVLISSFPICQIIPFERGVHLRMQDFQKLHPVAILQLDFHDVTTGTPARAPQSLSALFSMVKVFVSLLLSNACARRLRALLEIQLDDDSTTASLTVRCPQRYLFFFFHGDQRRI
ncbi:hypothetical protein TNCV_3443251 [Trichonephila clavipes]|nr:hypothetical protein TNCV_3443251 [Trichonephila clavipes]